MRENGGMSCAVELPSPSPSTFNLQTELQSYAVAFKATDLLNPFGFRGTQK